MRGVSLWVLVLVSCSSGQSTEECSALGTSAKRFAEAKLDALGNGCTSNADCVLFRAQLTCYTGCQRAIRLGRETSAQADLDGLSDSVCGSSGCSINDGCAPVHAECQIGRCRTVAGGDGGTPDAGGRDGG